MVISGLIPDDVDVRKAKAVFRELQRCPFCGGQGYRVVHFGSYESPPEQEGCSWCAGEGERFWSDGLEVYTEEGTLSMDTINMMRDLNGEAVCYGYWLMRFNGMYHSKQR